MRFSSASVSRLQLFLGCSLFLFSWRFHFSWVLKMHLGVKSRSNFEFFHLFSLSSLVVLPHFGKQNQSMKRPSWWKVPCRAVPKSTRYRNKWGYVIFEQWQKLRDRSIKLLNVEVRSLFKDCNFHLAQSLDTDIFDRDECLAFKLLSF